MKTLIAVPCMDQVAAPFCFSLAMLRKVGDCALTSMMSSLIYDSRNKLAAQALEMGADRMLWLDSDMAFNPDLLEILTETLEKDDRDIVTGVYYRRAKPYTPVLIKTINPQEDGTVKTENYDDYPTDGPFEVEGCGFGCVLMKTSILTDIALNFGTWFSPMANVGEDIAFCMRARELGYKIWCEPKAQCGHVGTTIITKTTYDAMKGQI